MSRQPPIRFSSEPWPFTPWPKEHHPEAIEALRDHYKAKGQPLPSWAIEADMVYLADLANHPTRPEAFPGRPTRVKRWGVNTSTARRAPASSGWKAVLAWLGIPEPHCQDLESPPVHHLFATCSPAAESSNADNGEENATKSPGNRQVTPTRVEYEPTNLRTYESNKGSVSPVADTRSRWDDWPPGADDEHPEKSDHGMKARTGRMTPAPGHDDATVPRSQPASDQLDEIHHAGVYADGTPMEETTAARGVRPPPPKAAPPAKPKASEPDPDLPAWSRAGKWGFRPDRDGSPAERVDCVRKALEAIRQKPVNPAKMATNARTILTLWRALDRPPLAEFTAELELVADAAHNCPDPLFARDIRAEGWEEGRNRARDVGTLCVQLRWGDRLEVAREWKDAGSLKAEDPQARWRVTEAERRRLLEQQGHRW